MKKVIRLTESDLMRIVKRVISEQYAAERALMTKYRVDDYSMKKHNFVEWKKLRDKYGTLFDGYMKIRKMLESAVGPNNSDEEKIGEALRLIPKSGGKEVYSLLLEWVQSQLKYSTIIEFIAKNIKENIDFKSNGLPVLAPFEGMSELRRKWLASYKSILTPYNREESFIG